MVAISFSKQPQTQAVSQKDAKKDAKRSSKPAWHQKKDATKGKPSALKQPYVVNQRHQALLNHAEQTMLVEQRQHMPEQSNHTLFTAAKR